MIWKCYFVTSPNATGAVRIHLLFEGAPGTAEWDDLSVEPKSTLEYGFESGGLAPWVPFGGVTAVVTAGAARTGSFGLELSGGSPLAGVFRDIGGLTPGQNYEVKVYVRSPPGSGTAFLWLHDATGANESVLEPAPTGISFQPVVLTYTANATGTVRAHLVFDGGAGTVAFDDLAVSGL